MEQRREEPQWVAVDDGYKPPKQRTYVACWLRGTPNLGAPRGSRYSYLLMPCAGAASTVSGRRRRRRSSWMQEM